MDQTHLEIVIRVIVYFLWVEGHRQWLTKDTKQQKQKNVQIKVFKPYVRYIHFL